MNKLFAYLKDLMSFIFAIYGTYWFATGMTPLYLWISFSMAMYGFLSIYARYYD